MLQNVMHCLNLLIAAADNNLAFNIFCTELCLLALLFFFIHLTERSIHLEKINEHYNYLETNFIAVLTPIGKEFRDVNSVIDLISCLWGRGLFQEHNVIMMQYLMRSLKRMDLEQMCVKYARKDKQALCYYEDTLNQGN